MPQEPGLSKVGEGRGLRFGLLDPVLTEGADARGEGLADRLRPLGLAHRDEGDGRGVAAGPGRRPGDPLPDGSDAVGDHFFGLSAPMSPLAVATFCAFVGFMVRYFSR